MAASEEPKKDLPVGKKASSVSLRGLGKGIARGVSSLKRKPRPRHILKIPIGRTFGKIFYTVQSPIEPVTFTKHKDAKDFQRLLKCSTSKLKSEIIRREITEEGYNVD